MKRIILSLAIAASTALTIAPQTATAQGQRACGDREKIVARLSDKYGETRQSMGLNHNNGVVEVFASTETGTWTIIMTMPTGMSCLVAAGESWDSNPAAITKSGMQI